MPDEPLRPTWLLPTPSRVDEPRLGDQTLRGMTLRLMRGENLQREEAHDFLAALLSDEATDAQIAAALSALAIKGETVEELAGMAEAMRERAVPLRCDHERFIDTAGTGSSGAKVFNVSTAAAFVIAGAGLSVAKHGSRAATSRSGSADVLQALGVNTGASPQTAERCLNEHGICFLFAPMFHRATSRVAQVRRELGLHTTFNLLGPLTNPARAPFQIVGVWHRSLLRRVAGALALLGAENAWVVHGSDGLDEITAAGETSVAYSARRDRVKTRTIGPSDFGIEPRAITALRGGGADENAAVIRHVLAGSKGVARDLVVLNAAAALHIAGVATDLREAATLAAESIDSGRAAAKLKTLIGQTNRAE